MMQIHGKHMLTSRIKTLEVHKSITTLKVHKCVCVYVCMCVCVYMYVHILQEERGGLKGGGRGGRERKGGRMREGGEER